MASSLNERVVIENMSGAGGSTGLARVARAAPDGYTLAVSNWTSHVGSPLLYPVQFDIEKDFVAIARLTDVPLMLIAGPKLPASDLAGAVRWLKAHPQDASIATIGPGSASHLCAVDLQNQTGTNSKFVPYRGGTPAIQDVVSGQVELMCGEASGMLPHVRGGTVKALAVMKSSRWFAAPDVPSIDEAGVPGVGITFWHGLWAPKGTPPDVVARLGRAVEDAFADPAVAKRLADAGQEIPVQRSAAALEAHFKSESAKWWPIIKAANIQVQ
jgi:tripartite-type tricarboxylate transporter receptor subunit TctC